ncbi:unnamed protein product [Larinioides sclopetarius]|uniref:Uncharacterized protein n=1 Tax=Larinioides sclopetarius TaxID=280406 RepID=A0AAV2BFF4_9ARAC
MERIQSLVTLCLAYKSCSRCGSDAGDIYLELVKRAGFTEHCHAANEESLAELLQLLELYMWGRRSFS